MSQNLRRRWHFATASEELKLVEKELPSNKMEQETGTKVCDDSIPTYGDLKIRSLSPISIKKQWQTLLYTKRHAHNGVIFHHIIKDVSIHVNQPEQVWVVNPIYAESFEDEFSEELNNIRGALSMVNAGPNTTYSQFYCSKPTPFLFKRNVCGSWLEHY